MRSALLLALLCLSPACDFFDDDSGDGAYVPYEEIASAYKDAYCTHAARCGLFPDKASCVSAQLPFSGITLDADTIEAIRAGKTYYNGGNVKKCFDALAASTCDETDQDSRVTPNACRDILRGLGTDAEPCFIDAECISGVCTGSTSTSCQAGQCIGNTAPTVEEPAAIGESCNSAGCVPGAYCDTQLTATCVALKTRGMTCVSGNECNYGLSCTGTTGTRTCNPLPGLNEACSTSDNPPCRDEGLYCDSFAAAPTCKQVGLPPASCANGEQCSTYYPCDSTSLKCTKAPSVGQSCAATFTCFDAGTYCDTTTSLCTALKGDGSMCTSDTQCKSDNCDLTVSPALCTTPATCL